MSCRAMVRVSYGWQSPGPVLNVHVCPSPILLPHQYPLPYKIVFSVSPFRVSVFVSMVTVIVRVHHLCFGVEILAKLSYKSYPCRFILGPK